MRGTERQVWQIDFAITFLRDDERHFVTEKIALVKEFFPDC